MKLVLSLEFLRNGEFHQRGNSVDMIFTVAQLISRMSEYMSWQPSDVMTTGTPSGVGMGMSSPQYLRPADKFTRLGEQHVQVCGLN